jgi:uncharacterized protein DUF5666
MVKQQEGIMRCRKEVIEMKVKNTFRMSGLAVLAVAALVLTSCGSGGNGMSSPAATTATPVVMLGTLHKDSGITVNGVPFDTAGASITADNTAKDPGFLDNGMTVKLKGRINDDRLSGVADAIKVLAEVRGEITAIGTDSFTILGQIILVNGTTAFADVADFAALKLSDRIEVHGLRDAAGNIMATRVELLGPKDLAFDEVRGIVSNMTATTLDINGLTVTFGADTMIEPPGATFGNGDIVEVHLNGTTAVRIEVEDAEDAAFNPAEGQEFEVEGFISGFTDASSDFKVGDQPVHLGGSVRFRSGDATDLGDNIMVEAEGHLTGGILLVDKITFKDTIRIEANADTAGSADVLGLHVAFDSAARQIDLPGGITGIAAGDGLKIRGFLGQDKTTITATRVKRIEHPVDADKILLQGPVSSFDATAGAEKLVIAGITVTISGVQGGQLEIEDHEASTGDLFGSIVLDRTIVKARGSFSGGVLIANKIEIEGD